MREAPKAKSVPIAAQRKSITCDAKKEFLREADKRLRARAASCLDRSGPTNTLTDATGVFSGEWIALSDGPFDERASRAASVARQRSTGRASVERAERMIPMIGQDRFALAERVALRVPAMRFVVRLTDEGAESASAAID